MRMFGKKYGFYPTNQPKLAYEIDILMEPVAGCQSVFGLQTLKQQWDVGKWTDAVRLIMTKCNESLTKNKGKFLHGNKLCITDFFVAGFAFTYWDNDMHPGQSVLRDPTMDVFDAQFSEYLTRLKAELRPQLDSRDPSPV